MNVIPNRPSERNSARQNRGRLPTWAAHVSVNKDYMKFHKVLVAIIPFALLVGCSNPAKDVPTASVEQPSQGATNVAATPDVDARYLVFGPTSAAVAFTGSKVTRSHNGGFKNFTGEFKVVNGALAAAGNK